MPAIILLNMKKILIVIDLQIMRNFVKDFTIELDMRSIMYNKKDGTLKQELSGLSYGEGILGGETAVAVDNKHIITFIIHSSILSLPNELQANS